MNYKNILTVSACALSLTLLSSCDSWLDNQPKGFNIPKTYDDYRLLMNSQGLYRSLNSSLAYFTDDALLTNDPNLPGKVAIKFTDKSEEIRNLYSFQHGQVLTPGNSDQKWNNPYSNIFTYNAIINNVLSSTGGTENERKELYGQALVGRAFEYLNLVNIYGNHYDAKTADTDYGVPLVLSEGITGEKYPRASVAKVYEQIENDLYDAANNYLGESTKHTFDPTKSVGFAFLSRMYLYMGKYDEALKAANSSLALNDKLIDYKLYKVIPGQWGRLVKIDDESESFPDSGNDNLENVYVRFLTDMIQKSVGASPDLVNTFKKNLPDGAEDLRFSFFYAQDEFWASKTSCEKFPGYTLFVAYISHNIGFSTAEVLLTAAECEARIGDKNKALALLDKLRDSRIKNNVHFNPTDYTKEQVLEMVIDERRKEFAFIGITRLVDLKRLNRESWFAKTITHSDGEETWTLPPNDPRYIMPIPETVLSFNDMPQYER